MTDRIEQPDPVENSNALPDISAHFLDSVRDAFTSQSRQLNVGEESRRISDLLSEGTRPERLESGVQRLSADLQTLSGDIPKYNQLLKAVNDGISDEPVSNPMLKFDGFNHKTGTWDKVTVNTYDAEKGGNVDEAYRIVQPGNTLSQIARDLKDAVNTDPNRTTADYMAYLQEINGIADANKINVGQAIRFHKPRA